MINKIIFRRHSVFQLLISSAGALTGLFLLLASIQLFFDFKNLFSADHDLLAKQFIVINKKVSALNTIGIFKSGFSKNEIEELKKVKGVESIGEFHSTAFEATASLEQEGREGKSHMEYTEIFFESVPDEYLDVSLDNWKYQEGDSILPVIIPTDFINLYNFGLAPGKGLPQISKSMASAATLKISARMNRQIKTFYGKIAGFSDRINAILVPESFVAYANKTMDSKEKRPSRLILKCNDPSSEALLKYLDDYGYETNKENMKSARLNYILGIILLIVMIIGCIIIALSLLNFIQYAQLLIERSVYELKTLIQLGYYHLFLWKKYFMFYLLLFTAITILSFLLLMTGKHYFRIVMQNAGFEIDPGISVYVFFSGLLLGCFFLFVGGLTLYRSLKKLAA